MKESDKPVDCYVSSLQLRCLEPYLEVNGFSKGVILFAIPSYGVLFKCRAEGDLIDLEFGALFALLSFIRTSLAKEEIRTVRVHSSNPQFVFSIVNNSQTASGDSRWKKMLARYLADFDLTVSYVPRAGNKTLLSPVDYPSTPEHQTPVLKPNLNERTKAQFKPIQKGIDL